MKKNLLTTAIVSIGLLITTMPASAQIMSYVRRIQSGNEFTVYFDKATFNDEGWTGGSDPMGTLKAGKSYQVTYSQGTYTCRGFHESRNKIHSASYSNANPNNGQISLWGRVFAFDGKGNVYDPEYGIVGTIRL